MNSYNPLLVFSLIAAMALGFSTAQVAEAQTGDAVIDSWISNFQRKGGNSAAPTSLNPSQYSSGVTKCNPGPPASEGNCPSDLLYTPNANTGGYQAFGVGLNNFQGGTYWYPVCYIVWVYYYDIGWSLQTWCDWYYIQVLDHAYGAAAARVQFGTNTTVTPWSLRPMSTLAFKANNVYTPTIPSVECTPIWIGASAPCLAQSNVYAVTDAGYEDKILIDDHNCNVILRSDSSSDAAAGCFTRDGNRWLSDLPSPYPDTTASDGPTPYVAAIGSAAPEQISEGQTYFWWINFYQLGLESAGTHNIKHNSAVTTNIQSAPGCSALQPWNCYFNVDQTLIAPAEQLSP